MAYFKRLLNLPLGWKIAWSILLASAFLVRVWGLDFGLPNDSRPDEGVILDIIIKNMLLPCLENGDCRFNPHHFGYPSLYFYFSAFWVWIGSLLYTTFWNHQTLTGFLQSYFIDPGLFKLALRFSNVCFGTLSVIATYLLARSLKHTRLLAFFAGILLAFSYLMIRNEHFGTVDSLLALFTTTALISIIRWCEAPKHRSLMTALVITGLAIGVKYPVIVLLLPICFGVWVHKKWFYQQYKTDFILSIFWVTAFVMLVFALTSPWLLIDFQLALKHMNYDVYHSFHSGFTHTPQPIGWFFYPFVSFVKGCGGLFCVFVFLGAIKTVLNAQFLQKPVSIVMIFLTAFFLLFAASSLVFTRYMMPVVPSLCVLAVVGISQFSGWFVQKYISQESYRERYRHVFSMILLVFVLIQPLKISLEFNRLLSQKDTRIDAREWLLAHITPGEAVSTGPRVGYIHLPASYGQLWVEIPPVPFDDKHPALIQRVLNPYAIATTVGDIRLLKEHHIRYVTLYESGPSDFFQNAAWEKEKLLADGAKVVAHWSPFYAGITAEQAKLMSDYDAMDAVYFPFSQFQAYERPGPEISILEFGK
ncbi:MAG: glycosyltransferase family 39 protein [Cyanobacteria bacterium]|nr:glycosyltransferase family 39 protein [Cyanobacteriota bacterium]